jgi:hypothetical protein
MGVGMGGVDPLKSVDMGGVDPLMSVGMGGVDWVWMGLIPKLIREHLQIYQ